MEEKNLCNTSVHTFISVNEPFPMPSITALAILPTPDCIGSKL